jgi:hypothetical protein
VVIGKNSLEGDNLMGSFVKISRSHVASLIAKRPENMEAPCSLRDALGAFVLISMLASAKGGGLVMQNINILKNILRCSSAERVAITELLVSKGYIAIAKYVNPTNGRSMIILAINPDVSNCTLGADDVSSESCFMVKAKEIYNHVKAVMNETVKWDSHKVDWWMKSGLIRPAVSDLWNNILVASRKKRINKDGKHDPRMEMGENCYRSHIRFCEEIDTCEGE